MAARIIHAARTRRSPTSSHRKRCIRLRDETELGEESYETSKTDDGSTCADTSHECSHAYLNARSTGRSHGFEGKRAELGQLPQRGRSRRPCRVRWFPSVSRVEQFRRSRRIRTSRIRSQQF